MKPGTKAYTKWLSTLTVGSKVVLGGKDCPKEERRKVREVTEIKIGGYFRVRCSAPKSIPSAGWESAWLFRETGCFNYYEIWPDYYLLPVPSEIHKSNSIHNRNASYISTKKKQEGFATRILKYISTRKTGVCMYAVKAIFGGENSTISARLNWLHYDKGLIRDTGELVCRHCKGRTGLTHYEATK